MVSKPHEYWKSLAIGRYRLNAKCTYVYNDWPPSILGFHNHNLLWNWGKVTVSISLSSVLTAH